MEITLGVCGTAGRKDDAARLSKKHFDAMCNVLSGLIEQCEENHYKIDCLISGGAAWADHCAVKLFLNKKVPHLRLYLPCPFESGSFVNGLDATNTKFNTAGTINYYHQVFQRVTGINSLSQIQTTKFEGASLLPCKGGFYGRNAMVAKSDFILAMTFGNKNEVKKGGTEDTIKRYLARVRKEGMFDKSFHLDLNSGEVFVGCTVPKEEKKVEKK